MKIFNEDFDNRKKWFDIIKNQLGYNKKLDLNNYFQDKTPLVFDPPRKLNKDELKQRHSFSSVNLEDLERIPDEYPITRGVRTTKEPSILDNEEKLDFNKIKNDEYPINLSPSFLSDMENSSEVNKSSTIPTILTQSTILKSKLGQLTKKESLEIKNNFLKSLKEDLEDSNLNTIKNNFLEDIKRYEDSLKLNDFQNLVNNYLILINEYTSKQTEYYNLIMKYYYGKTNNIYKINDEMSIDYYDSSYNLEKMAKDSEYLKKLKKEIDKIEKEKDLIQHRIKYYLKLINSCIINIINLDNKFDEFIKTLSL